MTNIAERRSSCFRTAAIDALDGSSTSVAICQIAVFGEAGRMLGNGPKRTSTRWISSVRLLIKAENA